MIYLIGSLRNDNIPKIAKKIRQETNLEIFDDWHSAGPEADDHWRDYEQARGHDLVNALNGHAARNVFNFDKTHLDRCHLAILILPAGRSGHLELGYCKGSGKTTAVLLDGEPERYDVMYQFADYRFRNQEEMIEWLEIYSTL